MDSEKRGFLKGVLTGVVSTLTCLLLVICITQLTGVVNWRHVFYGKSNVISDRIDAKLEEMKRVIGEYYLDDIDEEVMEDAICHGLINGLGDKYAAYYNKTEYTDMKQKNAGNYCGIGTYVSQSVTTGAITVIQPMKGSPAEKVGIRSGDVIYAIDGQEVTGMDMSQVVSQIKGEKGTQVKITIQREGEKGYLDFDVTRDDIVTETVAHRMLDGKIGYVAVSSFEGVTTQQFKDAIDDLEKKGEKGLVIDLRNNGGGLLMTAVDMLDYLLPKGKLVYTETKDGIDKEFYSDDKESFDKPIVVLVNENSASASEVFSGALQDYGMATLVGTTTYGKGIVQTTLNLGDGTAMKLTTAKYYTPKGRNIHGTGLTPDVEVKRNDTVTKLKKSGLVIDNQLEQALEVLNR